LAGRLQNKNYGMMKRHHHSTIDVFLIEIRKRGGKTQQAFCKEKDITKLTVSLWLIQTPLERSFLKLPKMFGCFLNYAKMKCVVVQEAAPSGPAS
jgi:hypothetical protein